MSASIKGDSKTTELESASRRPPTKRAHCKKFWWAWLAGTIVVVLIVVLVLIFAGVPSIAQKQLDGTTFNLDSLKILNPTAESFDVSISGTITGAKGAASHAVIDAFDASMFLDGNTAAEAIIVLPMDEIHSSASISVVKNDYPVKITNGAALDEFALKLMESESMGINIEGKTKVHIGKLAAKVTYREAITMTALNHLEGMVITSYAALSGKDYNIGGKVLIPNPSVVTIEMGDVQIGMAINGTSIGAGVIPGLILSPGLKNVYDFKVMILQNQLPAMLMLTLNGGSLSVSSTGTSINGTKIPWLSKPLEKLATNVPINTSYLKST